MLSFIKIICVYVYPQLNTKYREGKNVGYLVFMSSKAFSTMPLQFLSILCDEFAQIWELQFYSAWFVFQRK